MRSSNPVLSSLTDARRTRGMASDPYAGYYNQAPAQTYERPMTVDDVVTKTGITLGVIIAFAVANFGISLVSPGLAMMLTMVGAIGGLITVLISSFGKKFGSKAVTLAYAAFEGLFVGGISLVLSGAIVGNVNAGALIGQAVLGTVGVFIGMLYVYKTGAVKVTPKFNRIMTASMVGVLVLVLGNLLLSLFGVNTGLYGGGPIAIIFSLVCIGLAAMSFLQDFDVADRLIRQGAPANMAWGVALGLAVTLVWLYTEILRLLSYFQQR
ncbi:Bax inhibitor-1/YccA family protein [Corynebacterium sp. SCR221107]|uniref:Bax inhibitor-1/YccA family protein n=1 Tax=Corynebacterium sp. SCR221107 TaxID=3017361 RepID=UPI0022EC62A9|nr:Bax inhibitor-1/YccA family protein [Corynebacterium sp. SCR221107]WBT09642.1 Bax inhibitor-1/YccA family protein [Corynebacterium sp. SCR221107]